MANLTKQQLQQQYEGSRLAAAAFAASDIKALLSSNPNARELEAGFHRGLINQVFTVALFLGNPEQAIRMGAGAFMSQAANDEFFRSAA